MPREKKVECFWITLRALVISRFISVHTLKFIRKVPCSLLFWLDNKLSARLIYKRLCMYITLRLLPAILWSKLMLGNLLRQSKKLILISFICRVFKGYYLKAVTPYWKWSQTTIVCRRRVCWENFRTSQTKADISELVILITWLNLGQEAVKVVCIRFTFSSSHWVRCFRML